MNGMLIELLQFVCSAGISFFKPTQYKRIEHAIVGRLFNFHLPLIEFQSINLKLPYATDNFTMWNNGENEITYSKIV